MIILDDNECDVSINYKKTRINNKSVIYEGLQVGSPIYYNAADKIFYPEIINTNAAFVGYFLHYNKATNMVTVMFKNFLKKNPIEIPGNLKETYIQVYIAQQFETYKNAIIENMPRIKKLKRINLQMMNKTAALLMHDNINTIVNSYEEIFGDEKARELKASIVTTPLYILDKKIIKIYDFAMNELKLPDIETEGNFLSFFLYKDMLSNK